MVEKRSLGNALELSPEKLAFIHPAKAQPSVIKSEPEGAPEPEPEQTPEESDQTTELKTRSVAKRRGRAHRPIPGVDELSMLPEPWIPLTTRLRPLTADALRRAHLEQRLKRMRPATQQEIVEAAVSAWLTDHDYL